MSVLIKGMKMPRSCEYCRFSGIGGLRNERVVCMFTGANAYMNTVQYLEDCPLVEIPPHGRLIDADAFGHIIGQFSLAWEYGQGVSDCWDALLAAPTIIEEEDGE